MLKNNIAIAEGYYAAVNNKSLSDVEQYLHPHAELVSPLSRIKGKESVLNAVKGYMTIFNTLSVDIACGSGDRVLLVYNLDCPAPIGSARAAVLIEIQDSLIARIELFFDPRPFA